MEMGMIFNKRNPAGHSVSSRHRFIASSAQTAIGAKSAAFRNLKHETAASSR